MTIDERRAREEYDRENPWRPMCEARPDGTVSELLFNDIAGHYPRDPARYFMASDKVWYRVDPPERVYATPMNWRPAQVKLTESRRRYLRQVGDRYRVD